MELDGVAEVLLLPVATPGIRGAGVLRRLFKAKPADEARGEFTPGDGIADLGNPHQIFVTPGHVFVVLNEGTAVVGFDKTVADVRHDLDDGPLTRVLIEQLADSKAQLRRGFLAYSSTDPILLVAPEDATDDSKAFHFVHASGAVKVARYERETGIWRWNAAQGFQLGGRNAGSTIVSVQYDSTRFTFVWVAADPSDDPDTVPHSLHVQSMLGPSVGGSVDDSFTQHVVVLRNAPQCELYLFGDSVAVIPRSPSHAFSQEVYLFQLGRLRLRVLRVGAGVLELGGGATSGGAAWSPGTRPGSPAPGGSATLSVPTSNSNDVEIVDFNAVHRAAVLPAWLRESKCGVTVAPILAVFPRGVHRDLLILTSDGLISSVQIDGLSVSTLKLCQLTGVNADILGSNPQLFALQCYVGVVGAQETVMYRTLDGKEGRRPLSGRFNERLWTASYETFHKVGLWSPSTGIWEVRCQPVLSQANALSEDHTEDDALVGDSLAALLCNAWGLPRASGRYAVAALVHLSSLNLAREGVDPPAHTPDGNLTANRVRMLLPYIRAAVRSPSVLIATLHQQSALRQLLNDEVVSYTSDPDSTVYMAHMQSPSSGSSVGDLVKRYSILSDKHVRVLDGVAATENATPQTIEENDDARRVLIRNLLKGQVESDDVAAHSLQDFIRKAPIMVLHCALDVIKLANVLESEFPPVEEFRGDKGNSVTLNALQSTSSVLNDRNLQPPQTFDGTWSANRSLFEIIVRLLYDFKPERLEGFVTFAAEVTDLRQEMFVRAVRALPTETGDIRRETAQVCASLNCAAGDPCAAINLLTANDLWDDCVAILEKLADGGMMHVQVFKLLLKRMRESGVFPNRGLPILRNTKLAPPTFTATDLFELFAPQPFEPLTTSCTGTHDVTVGSIREYLTDMMTAQRPKDLLHESHTSGEIV